MTRKSTSSGESPQVRVRPAYPRDRAALVEFNRAMALETEGLELDPERLQRGVAAVFEDESRGSYFVAEGEAGVVGALMVTPEWSDWRNGVFWWIQSVYVVPDARGRGVFRRLYQYVERRARDAMGVCGLRLYVERENGRAQATYESVGMHRSGYLVYELDFVLGQRAHGAPPPGPR